VPAVDETYSYCSLPPVAPRELPAGMDPARVEAILVNESKWVNHTVLHYYRVSGWSSWR